MSFYRLNFDTNLSFVIFRLMAAHYPSGNARFSTDDFASSLVSSFSSSTSPFLDKTSRRRLIDHSESVASLRETFPTTCRLLVATLIHWHWCKALIPILLLPKCIFE